MGNRGTILTGAQTLFVVLIAAFMGIPGYAEDPPPSTTETPAAASGKKEGDPDFENEDTYIDLSDAVRSKQYVHRAILTSLVRDTNRFAVGRFYLSHMMGFNQVWQRGDVYSKFSSGLQGLVFGYVTPWGHGLEVGAELSAVSNVFVGYRYYIRPENFSLWGFLGGGLGTEISQINFAEGPPEAQLYTGMNQMGFLTLGVLVPTLDVGFKGEIRLNFYGVDRVVFTSGVGVIIFI